MRLVVRLLAVVAATALLAGGLAVAAEIGWAALGNDPWLVPYDDWYTSARADHWNSAGARSLFVLLVVGGLALIGVALARPRPRSLPLAPRQTAAGVSRRTVERALERAVSGADGVVDAKATIRRDRVRVRAATRRREGDLRPRAEEAARSCLRRVGVDGAVQVAVRVERQRG